MVRHAICELADIPTIRVNDQYFSMLGGMRIQETGQMQGMASLIKDIAADNEVELTKRGHIMFPITLHEPYRTNPVKPRVETQESLCERMIVSGGDISTTALHDHACKSQAATDFQNATPFNLPGLHEGCKHTRGRPYLPEQRPTRFRDARRCGCSIRIGILLIIRKSTHFKWCAAGYRNEKIRDFISL